jgi:hypothetical protein
MRFLPAVLLLGLLAASTPTGQAHGLVNAGELETLIVQDEASDLVTGADLGFDLVQLYVGEAHVPGLGDGLYVRTILYGGAGERPGLDGALSVRFEFAFGDNVVQHALYLQDGAFQGDFDQIVATVEEGESEVQRAFFVYPAGVGPGTALTRLRATSYVGQDARDVAPGGVILPGAQAEVPMGDSAQVVDSYELRGPVGYLSQVEVIAMADTPDEFLVTAWTGLKQGSQHILLAAAPSNGWRATVDGAGGDTPPGDHQSFVVRLQPGNGTYAFAVLTDIGGHVELLAEQTPDGLRVTGGGSEAIQPAPAAKESPAAAWPILAAFAAALLARKAQR